MSKNIGQQVAERDFSRSTVRALAKRGIVLQGLCSLPDEHGSYLNPTRGYQVSDNGCGRILVHPELLAIARG